MKQLTLNYQSIDLCNLHIFVQFYAHFYAKEHSVCVCVF